MGGGQQDDLGFGHGQVDGVQGGDDKGARFARARRCLGDDIASFEERRDGALLNLTGGFEPIGDDAV